MSLFTTDVDGIRFEVVAFFRMETGIELSLAFFDDETGTALGTVDLTQEGEGFVVSGRDDSGEVLTRDWMILSMVWYFEQAWLKGSEKVILKIGRIVDPRFNTDKRKWKL